MIKILMPFSIKPCGQKATVSQSINRYFKSLSAITFRQLPGSKALKWIQSNSLEWACPDTDSCFLSSWWSSFWSFSDSQRRSIQKPSVPHQCVIAQRSRNEHWFMYCAMIIGSPFFTALPSLPPQWEKDGCREESSKWLSEHMFVTLGIIEAPVVGEQLGILFLAINHRLGLRGVLKVLYGDKSKGWG